MNEAEFRKRGKEMVDYIASYMACIGSRRVTPAIEPGYLRALIPSRPPERAEPWEQIMDDVEKKILIGVTHWQHPRFHAYFPAGNSYPSILADMLSDGIGCVGFSWAASPACTELETIVLDWVGRMIALPNQFLAFSEKSKGGGVIQTSASECVLVSLLAARAQAIRSLKAQHPFVEEGILLSKLMAYCSKEAHSCVEKAAMIGFVKLRILEPDEHFSLRGSTLRQAMEEDRAIGLIPFFVSTTLGTTSCCSFDALSEIGPVCREYNVWMHVDSAYAGNAFICPEFRYLMKGVEFASSFNLNPNKWMLVNFDCSLMWVKDRFKLTQALVVDPLYLQHNYSDKSIDYRHWGIPLSRRFRSLKLWFVIRNYGVEGLRNYIREHCRLAKKFEELVRKDVRFEVVNKVQMGLVCFRLKGSNGMNQRFLTSMNASGTLHMVPASLADKYVIRFCVCAQNASEDDIRLLHSFLLSRFSHLSRRVFKFLEGNRGMVHAWTVIQKFAEDVLTKTRSLSIPEEPQQVLNPNREREYLRQASFGSRRHETLSPGWTGDSPLDGAICRRSQGRGRRSAVGRSGLESFDVGCVKEVETSEEELKKEWEEKFKKDLQHKRSFFVRMVSDPKIYNPKIARAHPFQSAEGHSNVLEEPVVEEEPEEKEETRSLATWISWPMAFLFSGVFDEKVPVRFRHLDTRVTLKSPNQSRSPSRTPRKGSPEEGYRSN
ncbi:unnamed protein product [Darwinula stevensoni]|uniref:Tyrosine decarboxylase n=1 Tax=Darwinula stevensoni TaxID=69355 RepID=A0A7R9A818_9CRUS|nr:unnamed protein product [Darwinula stevensoni]CAG0896050.1 unnamed protein product [Darwinula stevensoni]